VWQEARQAIALDGLRRLPANVSRLVSLALVERNPSVFRLTVKLTVMNLEWFKTQGAGYQTRINAVLRAFRDASA
jgi:uncharacterized protein (DUF4415 family)